MPRVITKSKFDLVMQKKELIELYKIALERFYHHDTILTQSYIGLAIVIPVFLAATGYLLGKNSPVPSCNIDPVKWGLLILACLLSGFYWNNSFKIHKAFKAYERVITRIADEIVKQESSVEIADLLVDNELDKTKAREVFLQKQFSSYLTVNILILIAFGLFLFLFLG